ncbi:Polyketide synthase enoylreductase [Penicillium cataractarum]|uniref:Polyketide synthase enoylreductase n=1 Tax=Penicillium cataractarum TaxID=2100454 RepID=A0A9W9VDL9_9EURO|nr:Polyketide synthase enoylreductase [Penicillium cataractarum]KAJ5378263.1 Polyketide synthase enoylreductase [Penicillium cataractarum]
MVSPVNAPAAKRRRTTSGLTAQQIQHKRELDRKAQRALRDRTKARIQELENDLARIKASHTPSDQAILEELQRLREENRQLKACLESIGQFAAEGLEQAKASQPMLSTPMEDTVAEQSRKRLAEGLGQERLSPLALDALEAPSQSTPDRALFSEGRSPRRPSEPHDSTFSVAEVVVIDTNNNTRRDSCVTRPGIAGALTTDANQAADEAWVTPRDAGIGYHSSSTPPEPQPGISRSIACAEPKHTSATCPLDQILLDFILSRRSMIARGVPLYDVLGPPKPSPVALLNLESSSTTHPIIRLMTEVLGTFHHVPMPEKMAFMYLMHLTTRWQISPSDESYVRIPKWLRPTAMQITTPHAAWIDNIPWPGARDMLIDRPDRYPFAVFSEFYSANVSVNWPYEVEDAISNLNGQVVLNSIFEKHILRLKNSLIVKMRPTMRAAQYNTLTNEVEVNEVPIPEPGEYDILIKNVCATLCHSDLMLFWGHTAEKPPTDKVTLGHENTGIVAAMGSKVEGFKVGDRVGCLGCSYACYECEGCQVHNLFCKEGTQRLHGFTTDGHFAEYSLADYRNCMVLPDQMDMVTAAPLFCAGVTAYHSVKKCGLAKGEWLAIIGCGGLGHLAIQYAKAMELRVIGIDISESQLESAAQLGADLVFNPATNANYVTELKEKTGGAHASIVLSASDAAYKTAPDVLRVNGLLMIVGIPKSNLSINALDILLGKYRIMGASSGTPQQMREPIQFSHKHGIKAHVTTFTDIMDIHQVIESMESGANAGRFGIAF